MNFKRPIFGVLILFFEILSFNEYFANCIIEFSRYEEEDVRKLMEVLNIYNRLYKTYRRSNKDIINENPNINSKQDPFLKDLATETYSFSVISEFNLLTEQHITEMSIVLLMKYLAMKYYFLFINGYVYYTGKKENEINENAVFCERLAKILKTFASHSGSHVTIIEKLKKRFSLSNKIDETLDLVKRNFDNFLQRRTDLFVQFVNIEDKMDTFFINLLFGTKPIRQLTENDLQTDIKLWNSSENILKATNQYYNDEILFTWHGGYIDENDYKSNLVNIIRYIEVMRISESGKFSKNDLKAFEEGYPTESLTLKIIPGLNSFPQLFLERT